MWIREGFPSKTTKDKEKNKIQGSHCVNLLWLRYEIENEYISLNLSYILKYNCVFSLFKNSIKKVSLL
jgi:hypothetical protein